MLALPEVARSGRFSLGHGINEDKVPMKMTDGFQSACTDAGDDLCLSHGITKEFTETLAMPAGWGRALKPVWISRTIASGVWPPAIFH